MAESKFLDYEKVFILVAKKASIILTNDKIDVVILGQKIDFNPILESKEMVINLLETIFRKREATLDEKFLQSKKFLEHLLNPNLYFPNMEIYEELIWACDELLNKIGLQVNTKQLDYFTLTPSYKNFYPDICEVNSKNRETLMHNIISTENSDDAKILKETSQKGSVYSLEFEITVNKELLGVKLNFKTFIKNSGLVKNLHRIYKRELYFNSKTLAENCLKSFSQDKGVFYKNGFAKFGTNLKIEHSSGYYYVYLKKPNICSEIIKKT
jgi:fructose-specific component phosphotransferase system IIB-like protein